MDPSVPGWSHTWVPTFLPAWQKTFFFLMCWRILVTGSCAVKPRRLTSLVCYDIFKLWSLTSEWVLSRTLWYRPSHELLRLPSMKTQIHVRLSQQSQASIRVEQNPPRRLKAVIVSTTVKSTNLPWGLTNVATGARICNGHWELTNWALQSVLWSSDKSYGALMSLRGLLYKSGVGSHPGIPHSVSLIRSQVCWCCKVGTTLWQTLL